MFTENQKRRIQKFHETKKAKIEQLGKLNQYVFEPIEITELFEEHMGEIWGDGYGNYEVHITPNNFMKLNDFFKSNEELYEMSKRYNEDKEKEEILKEEIKNLDNELKKYVEKLGYNMNDRTYDNEIIKLLHGIQ